MKLYENVIKALFVSFRSERGRGVIRNAFAPRDGGHLLLGSAPLPLPHFLSLRFPLSRSLTYSSFFFFISPFLPSVLFPRLSLILSRTQSLFLSFLLIVNFSSSPSCSLARLSPVVESSKKDEGAGGRKKSREMEGPRHRRRVINTVVPRCAALRSRLWIARLPRPRSRPSIRFSN